MNIRDDALPCTSCECRVIILGDNAKVLDSETHVYPESIKKNLEQTISILRTYRLGQTILTFLRSVIREQYCDFSKDLEEKATFELFAAISHLWERLNFIFATW